MNISIWDKVKLINRYFHEYFHEFFYTFLLQASIILFMREEDFDD